jgi:hypothetical protein
MAKVMIWREGKEVEIDLTELPNTPAFVFPLLAISDRQLAQGLAHAGHITEEEAEDWVGPGTVPAAVLALTDKLPEDKRFAARMRLKGAVSYERSDPLTDVLAAAYGWTPEQADSFWRDCAKL